MLCFDVILYIASSKSRWKSMVVLGSWQNDDQHKTLLNLYGMDRQCDFNLGIASKQGFKYWFMTAIWTATIMIF